MKKTYFLFLIAIIIISCVQNHKTNISELTVEYLTNPLGVDVEQPRFSWKIFSEERDEKQTAYQIIVGESAKETENETGSVWDSGKISGDETVNVEFSGKPLQSNTKYFWRVRVWLDDKTSVWSEPAFFHTGILNKNEWAAKWITTQNEIIDASPLLRKQFKVEKEIEQAVAYVTAAGFYEFYLNGQKVGNHVLDPGVTDYRETILYSTYDVTDLLKNGTNTAGAMLGNGAWNFRKTEGRWSWGGGGASFGNPALWMQLMIDYADGCSEVIVSDNSWKTTDGPVTFNNLYGGEDYDAQKEVPGWADADFDDAGWNPVIVANEPGGNLKSQLTPAIEVTQTLEPVKETNPEPGVFLFDLGQNIAGWWKLEVKGSPGQVIRIRGSETLNDSLFPKPLEEGDKMSTKFDYHAQTWTDYTLKSNETEVYEPRFFYTGFRYIEVTTSDDKNPEYLKVEGRVVRSANKRNGTFESSDSLLNQIHRAGVWSQMGNMQSYPTDCPHREKGAYNGDGQVIAEASMHDFHMAPFYTKWLNDMRDSQEENGRIPNTSPVLVGGMGGGVAWGSAYILIPWWMHHYYDDTRILEEHYPVMKEYLQYLKNLGSKDEDPSEPFIIDNFDGYWYSLGEWCAPGESDCPNHPVVNTFYYYYNSLLLSQIADELGFETDAETFRALSDTIKQHFNRKFFNPETALYGTEETYQTYQLLALVGDVVPEGYRDKVFQTIVDDIKMRDDHLNTGIIGTKYLWPVLVEGGENELAYSVATQTTWPSFGYWIENNSTTLLEKWSGENSHNHQMFGSITEYFYKFLAGIQSPMEGNTTKGYRQIHIEPHVPQDLGFVNASVETVAGKVVSNWKKEDGSFAHEVVVPMNTAATVALPVSDIENVTVFEGSEKIWENNAYLEGVSGIHKITKENDRLVVETGSGNYRFRVE
ncbi:alpha-L-rhamnosidase [Tangfeifania diversioriginum]|uniref:alpha-L-rhamnosidase n=1 Tax=Tangfeifania diversioriginum TaxID=1168035 RepID=A0A1M6C359_9BACT|nr:family 78 glycoside hydrolase catalytic domain [Tangfeifania diversioriginum]SHI55138.1 alpha-L-rhamnosidase [Tangfeifania diversioriginum]